MGILTRQVSVAGVATVSLLLGATACSKDESGAGDSPAEGEDEPTVSPPPPITERRPFAVGAHTVTLVDDSRTTPADPGKGIEEKPDRTIGLTVLYPTDGEGLPANDAGIVDGIDPPEDTDAPVADGELPLLVFAHGWNGSGASLVGPASRWASAGYIVALPTFPLSQFGIQSDIDLINQPGDVSFVIDTLMSDDSVVAGHVDPEQIAAGGHSLGSATAFGFQNSCCKDPRVQAIAAISGGPSPYSTGEYDAAYETPMLLVHGAKDPGVAWGVSDYVFSLPGKMSFLLFAEGTHTSHFEGEDGALLDQALVAYLDSELGLDPEAFAGLEAEVTASGRGTLRSKSA